MWVRRMWVRRMTTPNSSRNFLMKDSGNPIIFSFLLHSTIYFCHFFAPPGTFLIKDPDKLYV